MQGKVLTIVSPEKRTGVSQKTGKPWTIAAITVQTDDGNTLNADTFDKVQPGDDGTVEKNTYQKQDGSEGYSYTFKKPYAGRAGGGLSQDDRELLTQTYKAIERVEKLLQGMSSTVTTTEDEAAQAQAKRDQAFMQQRSQANTFSDGEPLPEYEGGY